MAATRGKMSFSPEAPGEFQHWIPGIWEIHRFLGRNAQFKARSTSYFDVFCFGGVIIP